MSYNMTRSFEDWGNSSLALRFPLFPILEDEHFCTEDCDCDADHQDFRFESFEKRTTAKYFDGYESRDIGEKYDSLIGSDVKQKTSDLIEKYIESDDDDEDTYVSLVQDDIRCGHSSTRYFESYQHSDEYKSILFGDNLEDHLTSTYFDASDEVDGFEDKSHQNQYTGDLREVETNQSFSDVVQIKSKCDRNDFGQGEKDKSHCNLTNDATVSDGVSLPAFSYDAVDCKTLGYFDVVEEYAAARSTDVQKESDASGDGDVPSQADELNNDADDEEEDDIVTLAKSVRQVLKAHVTHLQHKAMNLSSNQNVIDTLNEFRPSFIGGRNEMAIEAMQLLSQASHTDLAFEWSMLCQDCTECWTHTDLQLAAELGKTLLERNKALENSIKQQQAIIEDQTQEIEYLTKQTAVLRDVNDSRLKIYEQLEVSISELEIANKKLSEENTADKAMIKMLCGTIERLENRCDDLQRLMEETKSQQPVQRRRRRRSSRSKEEMKETDLEDHRSLHRQDARTSEEQDTDSPPYSGNSSHYGAKSSSAKVVDPFFHHHHQISQSSSTSSTTSSSPISSSGYSSSSVDSHLQRLSADSDSEPASLNSKDNPKETEDTTLTNCDEKGNESESSSDHHRQSYEYLKLECMESRERMSEMDRVLASLQSENERLRFERDQLKDQSPTDSLRSVDAEVQDVTCVRSGRLCRKCLGLMDATPANLISSAFGLMADTLQAELQEAVAWTRNHHRWWVSSHPWIDQWLIAVSAWALGIALATSLLQAVGLL